MVPVPLWQVVRALGLVDFYSRASMVCVWGAKGCTTAGWVRSGIAGITVGLTSHDKVVGQG